MFFPIRTVLRQNRSWLVMAAAIFGTGIIYFYRQTADQGSSISANLLGQQLDHLVSLFKLLEEIHPLISVLIIFINNFLAMIQMLLFGFLAGLSPLVTLFFNGALIGSLASIISREGLPLWSYVFWGILPHGIFELWAFFVCGGIGLKFGYHCIASPLPGMTRRQSYRYIWKEAISVLPLIVTLLLLAAVIEIYVTKYLLLRFTGA